MPDVEREQKVITAFCERMSKLLQLDWRVTDFPPAPDIDAKLSCNNIRTALDHTVLNSFEKQRYNDAQYRILAGRLESALRNVRPGYWTRVVFPSWEVSKWGSKSSHDLIESELTQSILTNPGDGRFHRMGISSLDLAIDISCTKSEANLVHCARLLGKNHLKELEDDISRALREKATQLTSSKRSGYSTILLIETTDISTINEVIVAEALATVAPQVAHDSLDSIFLFDDPLRDGKNHMVWPLKYKGVMPPNYKYMDEFRRAQLALVYEWDDRGPKFLAEL